LRDGRKRCFFEKKKQKIFVDLGLGRWRARGPMIKSLFDALGGQPFSSEKERLT
jgi:hypothetical protein